VAAILRFARRTLLAWFARAAAMRTIATIARIGGGAALATVAAIATSLSFESAVMAAPLPVASIASLHDNSDIPPPDAAAWVPQPEA
jgi:hypothetical protein